MLTPRGISSHQTHITDGVWFVETARHGGILVSPLVAHTLLSPEAIARGMSWAVGSCMKRIATGPFSPMSNPCSTQQPALSQAPLRGQRRKCNRLLGSVCCSGTLTTWHGRRKGSSVEDGGRV